ncbi:hypothetical protein Salat_0697000 [Sesamum alatum]|uniref:Uncharacterized protein n=1 Tax=Sesamum alatum TaxID=300844 RepID=A0AAE2CUR0_9LAMI|nr:hypothetical protein Salat_0697000 [Sesamum alatum]
MSLAIAPIPTPLPLLQTAQSKLTLMVPSSGRSQLTVLLLDPALKVDIPTINYAPWYVGKGSDQPCVWAGPQGMLNVLNAAVADWARAVILDPPTLLVQCRRDGIVGYFPHEELHWTRNPCFPNEVPLVGVLIRAATESVLLNKTSS